MGGQTALARLLGLKSQGTVGHWIAGTVRIPAERAVEVERLTGVSRSELRPDLYPPEPSREFGNNATTREPG